MSETVAILKIDGESGWCAFNIKDKVHARSLIEEVRNIIEGSYMPNHVSDESAPLAMIELHQKPDGWVATLPEFAGW